MKGKGYILFSFLLFFIFFIPCFFFFVISLYRCLILSKKVPYISLIPTRNICYRGRNVSLRLPLSLPFYLETIKNVYVEALMTVWQSSFTVLDLAIYANYSIPKIYRVLLINDSRFKKQNECNRLAFIEDTNDRDDEQFHSDILCRHGVKILSGYIMVWYYRVGLLSRIRPDINLTTSASIYLRGLTTRGIILNGSRVFV